MRLYVEHAAPAIDAPVAAEITALASSETDLQPEEA